MFVGAVVREAKQPNPNLPLTLTLMGGLLCYSGRPFDPELCVLRFDSRSVRQLNTNELTLTTLTQPTSTEEATIGRDGV